MNNKYLLYLGGGVLIVLIYLSYKLSASKPLTKDECYRLGSNERMYACLAEIDNRNSPLTEEPKLFPKLNDLKIEDSSMTGNTVYEPNPTFQATIRNNTSIIARNIILRIKFYKNKPSNCSSPADDTQYIKVVDSLFGGDSVRVKQVVKTNFDTSRNFNWCAEVVAAQL